MIESIYVVCGVLCSPKFIDYQNELLNTNNIESISNFFNCLEWGNIYSVQDVILNTDNLNSPFLNHMPGCKCESASTIKIQYLRLIYHLILRDSDNFSNKIKFLTKEELNHVLNDNNFLLFIKNDNDENANDDISNSINNNSENIGDNYEKLNEKLSLLSLFFYVSSEEIKYKNLVYKSDIVFRSNQLIKNLVQDDNTYLNDSFNCNFKLIDNEFSNLYLNLKRLKQGNNKINHDLYSSDSCGILNSLILHFILECPYSPSKYWMATCIEVFMRGNNNFFQHYVMNSGIVNVIIYDIIYNNSGLSIKEKNMKIGDNISSSQFLQSNFDLLSEIIRFNKFNIFKLNSYFIEKVEDDKSFASKEWYCFIEKITSMSYLIDSNVFIRSIILSLNEIKYELKSKEILEFIRNNSIKNEKIINNKNNSEEWKNSKFTKLQSCEFEKYCLFYNYFFSNNDNLCLLFINLLNTNIISISNIAQTNVSCLTTALIILFYNSRYYFQHIFLPRLLLNNLSLDEKIILSKLELVKTFNQDKYLNEMIIRINQLIGSDKERINIWKNLNELLNIWLNYYSHSSKDSKSLEYSTRINMSIMILFVTELKKKVEILLIDLINDN